MGTSRKCANCRRWNMYLRLEGAEHLRGHIWNQEIEGKCFKEIHRDCINLWWTTEVGLAQIGHITKVRSTAFLAALLWIIPLMSSTGSIFTLTEVYKCALLLVFGGHLRESWFTEFRWVSGLKACALSYLLKVSQSILVVLCTSERPLRKRHECFHCSRMFFIRAFGPMGLWTSNLTNSLCPYSGSTLGTNRLQPPQGVGFVVSKVPLQWKWIVVAATQLG